MISGIDFDKVDTATHEKLLTEFAMSEIDLLLPVAEKHSGYIIGSYLRDVIIPRNLEEKIYFRGASIWFTKIEDLQSFIDAYSEHFESGRDLHFIAKETLPSSVCHCVSYDYQLSKNSIPLTIINMIVSPKIPVNNYSIDGVKYVPSQADKLLPIPKITFINLDYVLYLLSKDVKSVESAARQCYVKFISKNWLVFGPADTIFSSTLIASETDFVNLINEASFLRPDPNVEESSEK